MFYRIRSIVPVAFGLLILSAHPASAKALEDRNWIEVRTPNFQIRSILGEKKTLELARHLEILRAAVGTVTNVHRTDSPVPTGLYFVRKTDDFEDLGIDPQWEGVFQPSLRRNFIVIRDVPGVDETYTLNRKYALYLLGDQGNANYPLWYKIGFSEYLSTAQVRSDEFILGGANEYLLWRVSHFPHIPLRDILSPKHIDQWDARREEMFHAESWMLVYFLIHRPEPDTLSQAMAHYVELVESGADAWDAFEEAFQISPEDLETQKFLRATFSNAPGDFQTQLLRFFKETVIPVYKLDASELLPAFEPEVVAMDREQISLALAQVALSRRNFSSAYRWFQNARMDDLSDPQAEAGLGDVLTAIGKFEEAQPHFELAVEFEPKNPYCQLDFGKYWYDRARGTDDPSERATYLARARERLVTAWKLDDSIPETYVVYGQTFLLEGRRIDLATEVLEKAESLLPANLTIRVLLAKAYLEAGKRENAAGAARSVLAWSNPDSNTAELAKEILAESAGNH